MGIEPAARREAGRYARGPMRFSANVTSLWRATSSGEASKKSFALSLCDTGWNERHSQRRTCGEHSWLDTRLRWYRIARKRVAGPRSLHAAVVHAEELEAGHAAGLVSFGRRTRLSGAERPPFPGPATYEWFWALHGSTPAPHCSGSFSPAGPSCWGRHPSVQARQLATAA
jgi:hypothetical protein